MAVEISLQDRVCLVTGSGAGIGRACAVRLAEAGGIVAVHDMREEAARETFRLIEDRGGPGKVFLADVGEPAQVERLIGEVGSTWGRIDVLVNNAGFDFECTVSETPLEDWLKVQSVHVTGMFLTVKNAARLFTAGSSVVNVASVHGSMTEPGLSAYAAAKGGILGMTRAMAQDLGPRTRVNAISPGYIHTRLIDAYLDSTNDPKETLERVIQLHPVGRIGEPADVANLVLFLASDLSSFLTGQNLTIDGGLTACLPRVREG